MDKEMLERVGKKFLDSFDTSRDGHIAKVELANYQLYLVAGEERTPIKVVWLFSHINTPKNVCLFFFIYF